ncbi:MAG: DNA primase [Candidatus Dojkabacteria bacterium]|nr:DNA primase [Candidatus Dojkabacteria bacterium]
MDSENQIEEIKNRLDIVQIVSKYIQVKQAGKNFSALCPFHKEKTPSFIISPDIQRYKCFGCGETGDIFNFIQKIENIDFAEALEKLAKEAGVTLTKRKENTKFKRLEEINYLATKYFYNELKKSEEARAYITQRGFSEKSIKDFGLGYAPKYPKLLDYIQKDVKYNKKELLDSGLFTLKEGKLREKFRDRIMFPIRSTKGNVIAFTGRIMPGNNWGPKYLNSPDTLIFHKKDNLFGQYESRQEIRKQDLAILCEGSTDVISAHQSGIKNIVAPLGTGLTTEQLTNLSKLTKNALLFFDNDTAGFSALIRAFKIASNIGVYPYATDASPYKDIDELIQKDNKLLIKKIDKKEEAFSFILSQYISDKNLNKMKDLVDTEKFIKSLISEVKDEIIKKHYIEKVEITTKIQLEKDDAQRTALQRDFKHVKSGAIPTEKRYMQLMLLIDNIKENFLIKNTLLQCNEYKDILKIIEDNIKLDRKSIFDKLKENEPTRIILEDLIFSVKELPKSNEEIESEILILKKKLNIDYLKDIRKNLNIKMAFAEEKGDNKKSEELLEEIQRVNKMLIDIENE